MTDVNKRNIYVDNLKCLLIILVVVGHFVDIALDESELLQSLFVFIYAFHMPLFIFVNGLLCDKIIKSKNRVIDKVVVFMGLYIALKAILFFTRTVIGQEDIKFHLFEEDGVPWYLFATAAYYVITYILRNINKVWLFVFSIVLALLVGYDPDINDVFVLSRIIVFYPFFIVGWALNAENVTNFMSRKWVKITGIVGVVLFAAICILCLDSVYELRPLFTGRNGYDSLDGLESFGPLLRLLSYAISFLVGAFVMAAVPHMKLKLISTVGRRTLAIFFLHRPVLYCLTYAGTVEFLREHVGWTVGNVLWLLIGVLLALILAAPIFTRGLNKIINLRK